jgi:hypothetical protein
MIFAVVSACRRRNSLAYAVSAAWSAAVNGTKWLFTWVLNGVNNTLLRAGVEGLDADPG